MNSSTGFKGRTLMVLTYYKKNVVHSYTLKESYYKQTKKPQTTHKPSYKKEVMSLLAYHNSKTQVIRVLLQNKRKTFGTVETRKR